MMSDRTRKTHPGQHALLPDRGYKPPPAANRARYVNGQWQVAFAGDDGRTKTFSMTGVVLPGWHEAVAGAFADLTGPAGARRTLASANAAWQAITRLLRFLAMTADPPTTPADLQAADLDAYLRQRQRDSTTSTGFRDNETLRPLFRQLPLAHIVPERAMDLLSRRERKPSRLPTGGYSTGEFTRLVRAARTDVAALRDRIAAGNARIARWHSACDASTGEDSVLVNMAETGVVPRLLGQSGSEMSRRTAVAQQLFVTRTDREPILVLLAAVTGCNSETLKELPATHRVLDGKAVQIQIIKRRRGPNRWQETLTWEIGPPHRELHTPGGLYLLLHRLMARGRHISGSPTIWSTWRNNMGPDIASSTEHRETFGASLSASLAFGVWGRSHNLRVDANERGTVSRPLPVDLRRIRTTVAVRTTKSVGGHLPSAARSNTIPVLYGNYLRGDPAVHEWASDIITTALVAAERGALRAHQHALEATGPAAHVRVEPHGQPDHAAAVQEGAWTACADPDHHPATTEPCRSVSFLDCFHCGNCLVTPSHLPAITALLDTLIARKQELSEQDWWQRYGPVWAAIRHDILPKFSPAEIALAQKQQPQLPLLEMIESPWERT